MGNLTGGVSLAAYTNRTIPKCRNYEDWEFVTPHGGSEFMTAVTGREYTTEELDRVGARITHLIRAIWVRDGYTTFDDPFWKTEVDAMWPIQYERVDEEGRHYIPKEGFEATIQDYYKERGWIDGVPTRATLESFGLKDVADDLDSQGLLKG